MPIALKAIKKGSIRKPMEDIDPDVIGAVEEAYKHCLKVEDERIQAEFANQDEAEDFLRDARSYAYQRPEGRVVVIGNTTKKGTTNFRVETYVKPEENEKASE